MQPARGLELSRGARVALCAGATLNPVNSTMIATALAPISDDFDIGVGKTGWLVSAMYLACAIGQPLAGRLADRWGPRRVFLGGTALVAVAGLVGLVAPSFGWLVAARALTGLGTSTAYPSAVALLREVADAGGAAVPARTLGSLNAVSLLTLTVGPLLGGLLVDSVGWRAVFAVNAPLGLAVFAVGWRYLPGPSRRGLTGSLWREVDVPGLVLFSGAITSLLVLLGALPAFPWPPIAGLLLCSALLVAVELRTQSPFLDVRMIAHNGQLVRTYVRSLLSFFTIYGVLFGLTTWLQQGSDFSASASGAVVLVMSAVGAVASFAGGRARRAGWPLLGAALGLLVGSVLLTFVEAESSLVVLICALALLGLPNGMGLVANQLVIYRVAPAAQVSAASGLSRTVQYTSAMLATSVTGLVFAEGVDDGGLQTLAWTFTGAGVLLLVLTVADRTLWRRSTVG